MSSHFKRIKGHYWTIGAILFLVLYAVTLSYAIPPTSPYVSSDHELDPNCAPGGINCYVNLTFDEADTLDTVSDRGNITDQTLTVGGLILPALGAANGIVFAGSSPLLTYKENNTALGVGSLVANVYTGSNHGIENVAIGFEALKENTTGDYNTSMGSNALIANTSGSQNTAVGAYTLQANTTGNFNLGVGSYALYANTTGIYNTAIGASALNANTTGNQNLAMGTAALFSSTTASANIALGYRALYNTTSGYQNVAIGPDALRLNVVTYGNIGIGINTLENYVGDGSNNGYAANTVIGYGAAERLTSGANTAAFGAYALNGVTGAVTNTVAIGAYAGSPCQSQNCIGSITSIVGSTFIGPNAQAFAGLSGETAWNNRIALGSQAISKQDGVFSVGNGIRGMTFNQGTATAFLDILNPTASLSDSYYFPIAFHLSSGAGDILKYYNDRTVDAYATYNNVQNYTTDLSGSYTARSLVDKAYVDSLVGGTATNITGLISAGSNVSLSGSGTSGSPYIISASGGGSNPTLQEVTNVGSSTTDSITIGGLIVNGDSSFDGTVSIGSVSPTALLTLAAGTATANSAPLKFTVGTNLSTPEAGAMEYDGTSLFFTPSTTRYNAVLNNLGFAGGQSIIGGTGLSENLTLSSTSFGTKGKILFGTSAYDEANNRFGIGTASPANTLDIRTVNGTTPFKISDSGSNTYFQVNAVGTNVMALGINAGSGATNAAHSIIIGFNAGVGATDAYNSNFIGIEAGLGATDAIISNFIGSGAGKDATNAFSSNLFGYKVGSSFTGNNIGSNNIIIGTNISLPDATTNAINIGGVLFGTGTYNVIGATTPSITPSSGGRIGIGTIPTTYTLEVGNSSVSGIVAQFTNSNGVCTINPTSASVGCSSDERLKKNITNLSDSTLDKILSLRPVTYNWNKESDTDGKHVGFIAQEVEAIFPDIVTTDPTTGLKSVAYTNFIPYTVKAVQEMNVRVAQLPELADMTLTEKVRAFLEGVAHDVVRTKTVETETLCVGPEDHRVCVNADQLQQLVNQRPDIEVTPPPDPNPDPVVCTPPQVLDPVTNTCEDKHTEPDPEPSPDPLPEPEPIPHDDGGGESASPIKDASTQS